MKVVQEWEIQVLRGKEQQCGVGDTQAAGSMLTVFNETI